MSSISALERSLGTGGALLATALALAVVLLVIHALRRRGAVRAANAVATVALLVALAGVALVTLRPAVPTGEPAVRRLILDPVLGASDGHGRTVWRPFLANVALFVPLGALAAARFPGRGLPVWIVAAGLSVGIEAVQYGLPIGRIANSADVVANAAGAALGIALDRTVAAVTGSRRVPARRAADRHGTKATLTMPGSRAANRS